MTRLVGARVPRLEDPRLLRGRGHFVDDLQPTGLRHAAFVRSPFAHAHVTGIDPTAARAMPGVDLVLTPFHDRVARTRLGVVASSTDQCFGHWSGTVRLGDDVLDVEDVEGWAEDVHNRW